jgi:hypothetical protein
LGSYDAFGLKETDDAEYITKNKPTLYKNSLLISTAFGSRINVVSQQNKLQPYNKRPVGIKVYSPCR